MRYSLAIFAGYLIFAGSAVLLFQVTRIDPHSPAAVGFDARLWWIPTSV